MGRQRFFAGISEPIPQLTAAPAAGHGTHRDNCIELVRYFPRDQDRYAAASRMPLVDIRAYKDKLRISEADLNSPNSIEVRKRVSLYRAVRLDFVKAVGTDGPDRIVAGGDAKERYARSSISVIFCYPDSF